MSVKFVSRAAAGLRNPKSVSRNVTPSRGGVAVHYGGAGAPPSTHAGCVARWKSWQDFHMNGRGWADIAYNYGFCNHGYVFAGRGFGVRSAANGTNDGNQRFMAACWIGGGNHTPTPEAYAALDWIVAENRRLGAGRDVRPHRYFKSTGCPGTALAARAAQLHGSNVPGGVTSARPIPSATKPKPARSKGLNVKLIDLRNAHRSLVRGSGVKPLQRLLGVRADGLAGPDTRRALGNAQKRAGVAADYIFGPASAEAFLSGKGV